MRDRPAVEQGTRKPFPGFGVAAAAAREGPAHRPCSCIGHGCHHGRDASNPAFPALDHSPHLSSEAKAAAAQARGPRGAADPGSGLAGEDAAGLRLRLLPPRGGLVLIVRPSTAGITCVRSCCPSEEDRLELASWASPPSSAQPCQQLPGPQSGQSKPMTRVVEPGEAGEAHSSL